MAFIELSFAQALTLLLLATLLISLVYFEAADSGVIEEEDASEMFPLHAHGDAGKRPDGAINRS
jgi:hypothetical protein